MKARDYTGMKFNKLTAICFSHTVKKVKSKRYWTFQCDCGRFKEIEVGLVVYGKTASCGQCGKKQYKGEDILINCVFKGSSSRYSDGDIDFETFKWMIKQPCFYCDKWRPNTLRYSKGRTLEYHGLDRLLNCEPHNKSNTVTSCWFCNNKKSNTDFTQFLEWIQDIYLNRINL